MFMADSNKECSKIRVGFILRAAILIYVLGVPQTANAQCDCDHTFGPDTTVINGVDLGISPGDRVCIMAGDYEFLRFQAIVGTQSNPVTITNCGGLVTIYNGDRAYGLVVEDESSFFHLTGTGDASITYGFDISAPDVEPWPGVGLVLGGKSTNYEVDHLEIHHTGFAGVTCKTDPICDGSADQSVFVQRDVIVHHLYVHDTGGEGFYVGSTQSDGHTITCDGVSEVHQPHLLEGISLHHNIIERTGWDGMQVGMASSGCMVWANTIQDVGSANEQYQQQGLQIGTYSSCNVYNNIIMDGPQMGIIILGAATSRFYNNLIVNFGADGIYAHQRDAVADTTYEFFFNTIVNHSRNGIRVHGENLGGGLAQNNLIVGPANQVSIGNEVPNFVVQNNLEADLPGTIFMVSDDFHPSDASPVRNAGVAMDIDFDLNGMTRPSPPSIGAYEHSEDAVGSGEITPPEVIVPSPEDDGTDDSSCNCQSAGAKFFSSIFTLLFIF